MANNIKVVLSGSGLLYPLHVGAINALHDLGFGVEEIAGVSGGAIIAAAVASGIKPGIELEELVLDTIPSENRLIDISWCPLKSWGLIKGNRIKKEIAKNVKSIFDLTSIPLKVFAVNIDEQGNFHDPLYTVFGTIETPEVSIADAVRASLSIPGVFKPHVIDGQRFIDGGIVANYPLSAFGKCENVVGFHIRGNRDHIPPSNLKGYAKTCFRLLMEAVNRQHIDEDIWGQTVLLETNQSSLNFRYGADEARDMIRFGYLQAKEQLRDLGTVAATCAAQ